MKNIMDMYNKEFYKFVEFGALALGISSIGFGGLLLMYGVLDFGADDFLYLLLGVKFCGFGFALLFGLKLIYILQEKQNRNIL